MGMEKTENEACHLGLRVLGHERLASKKLHSWGSERGSCVPKPETLNRAFQTIPPFSSKSKARPSAAHRQAQSILARVRSLGIQGADIQRFESEG